MHAIGRGSFGKVCLVQKKDTKQLYALKYMNKEACIKQDAVDNVLRELEILRVLDHPFVVNVWFSFQDFEDMFIVADLMLGGDLRYHLQQNVEFDESTLTVYFFEIASALDYLRTNRIIHRDVKPENILLDKHGFAHLSDFNVAAIVTPGVPVSSMTGTKEYMAPEIFRTALGEARSYSYEVDWWSLGVTLYELLCKKRPFDIRSDATPADCKAIINTTILKYPSRSSKAFVETLKKLMHLDPLRRLRSLDQLKKLSISQQVDANAVYRKLARPGFTPSTKANCDPTYELEELLVESHPLHKKKKRMNSGSRKSQKSGNHKQDDLTLSQTEYKTKIQDIEQRFKIFNREKDRVNPSGRRSEPCNDTM